MKIINLLLVKFYQSLLVIFVIDVKEQRYKNI